MKGHAGLIPLALVSSTLFAQIPCQIHIYNRTQTPVTFITSDARLIGNSDATHPWVESHHVCLDEKPIIALTTTGHAVSRMQYWVTPAKEALLTYPDSFHLP